MSSCIFDSSAVHTPPQFTRLMRRKIGFSPRHLRQSAVQWTFPVSSVSACGIPHADCVTRPAVLAQITQSITRRTRSVHASATVSAMHSIVHFRAVTAQSNVHGSHTGIPTLCGWVTERTPDSYAKT